MSNDKVELTIDLARILGHEGVNETGIPIRAKDPVSGKWGTWDVANLDKESLKSWLRSRGGENPWAENVVGVLLGHGNLYE